MIMANRTVLFIRCSLEEATRIPNEAELEPRTVCDLLTERLLKHLAGHRSCEHVSLAGRCRGGVGTRTIRC